MKTESDSKISQRFLQTDCRFGSEAIDIWKRECRSRCAKKEKTDAYHKYLGWKPGKREVALFSLYAYADLNIPKTFSCIFNYRKPEVHLQTQLTITQSIWEGWFPLNTIDHGHKHLIIANFEEEIPNLILELHVEKEKFSSVPKGSLMLGICQIEDYEKITLYLKTVKELRSKYGADWYDYYEEPEK
jgi:hypothetical protein